MQDRKIDDILESKGREVVWIDPLETVYTALKKMNEENIGALLVQIDGYIVGVVSERDYVRKVILDRHGAEQKRVSEIMTHEPASTMPSR
jgi:CBS domain-containing protein